MAININNQPADDFNPVYNPVVYEIESTNKNKLGFRYIVQVKSLAGGNPVLFEKTIIPEFDNGTGIVQLDRELSDYITYNYSQTVVNVIGTQNDSFLRCIVEFGEEYFESWEFEDFFFVGGADIGSYNPNSLPNATSLVIRKSQGGPAPYTTGDSIFVTLVGDQSRPQIAGVKEVLRVGDRVEGGIHYWEVVLNMGWVGSGPSDGGSTRYSDNRKTRFLGVNTELPTQTFFNGAYGHQEWNNYSKDDYVLDNSEAKVLSQIFDGYRIRENSRCYINFVNIDSPDNIRFRNDSGEEYRYNISTGTPVIRCINVGLSRTSFGSIQSGSGALIKPTTKSYSFQFYQNNTPISREYSLTIDRSCVVGEYKEINYLDKRGSFLPWYFTLINTEKHNINRSTFERYNGNFTSGKWRNQITFGGHTIHHADYDREYLLRTDWLNERDATFFHNVVESPVTFINEGGQMVACVMETNSVEILRGKRGDLKRYDVVVKMSNKEKINI